MPNIRQFEDECTSLRRAVESAQHAVRSAADKLAAEQAAPPPTCTVRRESLKDPEKPFAGTEVYYEEVPDWPAKQRKVNAAQKSLDSAVSRQEQVNRDLDCWINNTNRFISSEEGHIRAHEEAASDRVERDLAEKRMKRDAQINLDRLRSLIGDATGHLRSARNHLRDIQNAYSRHHSSRSQRVTGIKRRKKSGGFGSFVGGLLGAVFGSLLGPLGAIAGAAGGFMFGSGLGDSDGFEHTPEFDDFTDDSKTRESPEFTSPADLYRNRSYQNNFSFDNSTASGAAAYSKSRESQDPAVYTPRKETLRPPPTDGFSGMSPSATSSSNALDFGMTPAWDSSFASQGNPYTPPAPAYPPADLTSNLNSFSTDADILPRSSVGEWVHDLFPDASRIAPTHTTFGPAVNVIGGMHSGTHLEDSLLDRGGFAPSCGTVPLGTSQIYNDSPFSQNIFSTPAPFVPPDPFPAPPDPFFNKPFNPLNDPFAPKPGLDFGMSSPGFGASPLRF